MIRVAILGGGMGGLACAHELAGRGLDVTVYEAGGHLGGKARSHDVAGTGTGGRRDLPGEHGFRFYPAFYRHVIETMKQIPDRLSPTGTVAGNLVGTPEAAAALDGRRLVVSPRRPRGFGDAARAVAGVYQLGGNLRDLARYLGAHLKYLTACEQRRDGEIEALSWAAFIGAETPGRYRESFREVLLSCTRTMVAMNAERGSSRTLGRVSSLLLLDGFGDVDVDRTMMGPTSACWLDPWEAELRRRGVRFVFGARVAELEMRGDRIARAWLTTPSGPRAIEAEAFVLAVPLEAAHRLVSDELAEADPSLARLARLDLERVTNWMVGAQFFLREDVPMCEGHVFYPRSPWALTSISQAQFWNRGARGMSSYGDGGLRGILSVDVSDCFAPDRDGTRLVDETSRAAILERIFGQVLEAVDAPTRRALRRALFASHLDDEVQVGPSGVTSTARLLIHPPGSWRERPDAALEIPNLFLAADYVRTSVDLASMEGANEAGRRAARALLARLGLAADGVKLFAFEGLDRFGALRRLDRGLHAAGLPHLMDAPAAVRGLLRPEDAPPFAIAARG
ncbi:MAG TPA: FAD-dependent oxidoreductase [Polyangia bacterium]|nr:FAD-dependent oxidoreductase [Polyangia bacterium]